MKNHENILVYDISYETLFGSKPLRVRFDRINGFIRVYDRIKYFASFISEKYDVICNRIRYFVGQKSCIMYGFSHNYAKIKVISYDSLHLEKMLTLHNVIILIKLVLIKIQIITTTMYF